VKIELEVSEENEGTDSPWWAIVNPGRGFLNDPHLVAHCIVGPFFSREAAETELKLRRYNYHKNAIVWCFSGYHSAQYKDAVRKAK